MGSDRILGPRVDFVGHSSVDLHADPVTAFLGALSVGSRPSVESRLKKIISIFGYVPDDLYLIEWGGLNYEHVQKLVRNQ